MLDEVGTCDGVMPMVEKSPCVDDEKLPNSFVHLGCGSDEFGVGRHGLSRQGCGGGCCGFQGR